MSAIFGVFNRDGKSLSSDDIIAMTDSISYRGVDGSDTYLDGNIALGHHLLCVTPESKFEKQPFEKDGLIITADARIDNRDELKALGINVGGDVVVTDPEIILQAYQKWGDNCPKYLEGDFAFVIWDVDKKELFCATDHLGARYLNYYVSSQQFVFGSEIKAILSQKTIPKSFNENLFSKSKNPETKFQECFVKDVLRLKPGHSLRVSSSSFVEKRYWKLKAPGKYNFSSDQDWANCLRDLIIRSVKKRTRTDYPVGVTLSGGLDSSAVACISVQCLSEQNTELHAFSSVLPENYSGIEKDEREYIDLVANKYPNIKKHYVLADGLGPFDDMGAQFYRLEKLPHSFQYMRHALYEEAKQNNVRVILDGHMGDEFASFKGRFAVMNCLIEGSWLDALKLFRLQLGKKENTFFTLIYGEVLLPVLPKSFLYILRNSLIWIKRNLFGRKKLKFVSYARIRKYPLFYKKYLIKDVNRGKKGGSLAILHNTASHYGMDHFSPLADKDIIEFILDTPYKQFYLNAEKRSLFKRAMEGIVPEEILNRNSKHPFTPDFHSRVMKSKNKVFSIIETLEDDKLLSKLVDKHKLVDKQKILQTLKNLKPAYGWNDWNIDVLTDIVYPIYLVEFYVWSQKIFDDNKREK